MTLLDNIKIALLRPVIKAAYDLMPVGVQGRPQRPAVDIRALETAYATNEVAYACIDVKSIAAAAPACWSNVERITILGQKSKGTHYDA